MPTLNQHLRKAQHNENFATHISPSPFLDWLVTTKFYAALHYIDAYLANKGIHPKRHRGSKESRDTYIGNDPNLRPVYHDYRRLREDSEDARYEVREFLLADITNRTDPCLIRIKNHLRQFLPQIP